LHGVPTVRDARRRLLSEGWYRLPRKATSHEQYKHPNKPGKVTLSGKDSDMIAPGTWKAILKQAGWL